MLEPLILLTVLNCLFMFSSTVTSCALWWQYQRHKNNDQKETCDDGTGNSKLPVDGKKKNGGPKPENLIQSTASTRSPSNINNEKNSKRKEKKRSKSNLKYLSGSEEQKNREAKSAIDSAEVDNLEETAKKSEEASQTVNEGKSTVVMEFSTVQRVVQLFDNDTISPSTPRLIFDDSPRRKDADEKLNKVNFDTQQKYEIY